MARLDIEQKGSDTGQVPAISFVGYIGGRVAELREHGALSANRSVEKIACLLQFGAKLVMPHDLENGPARSAP
jgi:hypothetical protein